MAFHGFIFENSFPNTMNCFLDHIYFSKWNLDQESKFHDKRNPHQAFSVHTKN